MSIQTQDESGFFYEKMREIAWFLKFHARIGITTTGFGSTHKGKKEHHQNLRLKGFTGTDYFAKIVPQDSDKVVHINRTVDDYYECDALVVQLKNLQKNGRFVYTEHKPLLISNTADSPIIGIIDKQKRVMALVHSGWKSTQLNIVGKTIKEIISHYDIKLKDLRVFVWPGICVNEYIVGDEFNEYFPGQVKNNRLDLKAIINNQLLSAGLNVKQIMNTNKCSYCTLIDVSDSYPINSTIPKKSWLFFSNRREHDLSNRLPQPLSPAQEKRKLNAAKQCNCIIFSALS